MKRKQRNCFYSTIDKEEEEVEKGFSCVFSTTYSVKLTNKKGDLHANKLISFLISAGICLIIYRKRKFSGFDLTEKFYCAKEKHFRHLENLFKIETETERKKYIRINLIFRGGVHATGSYFLKYLLFFVEKFNFPRYKKTRETTSFVQLRTFRKGFF